MLGLVFGLHLLGYDIWFFATHILFHKWSYAWSFHKIHHEKRFPYWFDTYHAHWSEGPLQSLGFLFPWALGYWCPYEFGAAFLVAQVRGLARHDPRMIWLTGRHHLLHHEYPHCNYGEPWLDRLYGTWKN